VVTEDLSRSCLRECAWHAEDCATSIRKRHGTESAAKSYDGVALFLHALSAEVYERRR
jgi:hypothetical protein